MLWEISLSIISFNEEGHQAGALVQCHTMGSTEAGGNTCSLTPKPSVTGLCQESSSEVVHSDESWWSPAASWSPRSCPNLKSIWLWGHVKSICYLSPCSVHCWGTQMSWQWVGAQAKCWATKRMTIALGSWIYRDQKTQTQSLWGQQSSKCELAKK